MSPYRIGDLVVLIRERPNQPFSYVAICARIVSMPALADAVILTEQGKRIKCRVLDKGCTLVPARGGGAVTRDDVGLASQRGLV